MTLGVVEAAVAVAVQQSPEFPPHMDMDTTIGQAAATEAAVVRQVAAVAGARGTIVAAATR